MTFLPIVARELAVTAKRPSTYSIRAWASLIAILVLAGLLVIATHIPPAEQGRLLFSILSTGAYFYCLLAGIRVTADCMSLEKREGTLGLLFLTDLKGYDIVLGKVASSSLHSLYGLIAIMPVLALALVLGGLTAGEMVRIALTLVNTLFVSLSAGVLVSTISKNERKAMFGTILLLLITTLGPLGLGLVMTRNSSPATFSGLDLALLAPSPVMTFLTTQSNAFGKPLIREFTISLFASHLVGWIFLLIASRILPRMCQDRPQGVKLLLWRERWERWSYGHQRTRNAYRARMLDQNPFFWLAGRDRLKVRYVWGFLGALALLWFIGYSTGGDAMIDWGPLAFLHLVIHTFLKIWVASEVCSRLVEDRRSGALELLLSSPLSVAEIARGQDLALRRQFGKPVLFVLAMDLLFLWRGWVIPSDTISRSNLASMIVVEMVLLVTAGWALKWLAMWRALQVTEINRAILDTVYRVVLLPWVLLLVLCVSLFFGYQLAGRSASEVPSRLLIACWALIGLTTHLWFGYSAKRKVLGNFRAIATQTFQSRNQAPKRVFRIPSISELISKARQGEYASPRLVRRYWWAWSLLAVLGLGIGSLWWYRASLAKQVKAKVDALHQAGSPVTSAALNQLYPSVPRGENAADLFTEALRYLVPPESISKAIPQMGNAGSQFRNGLLSEEMRSALSNSRAKNQKALEIVRRGAALEKSHYMLDLSAVHTPYFNWRLFTDTRKLAYVMQLDAIFSAAAGQAELAIQDVNGIFAVGRSLNNVPVNVAQWHGNSCLKAAVFTLEYLLSRQELSDAQLRQLSAQIVESDGKQRDAFKRSLQGDLYLGIQIYRLRPEELLSAWMGAGTPRWNSFAIGSLFRLSKATGQSDRDFLFYLQSMEECLAAAQLPFPQIIDKTKEISQRNPREHRQELVPKLSVNLLRNFEESVIMEADLCARLRAAQTALAIERYRWKNGNNPPEKLEQLLPDLLPAIPLDPFDGQPLRYIRLPESYTVYSVGRDGADDGGQESQSKVKTSSDVTFIVER